MTPAPTHGVTSRIVLAALAGVVLAASAVPLTGATAAAKKAPAKKACVLKKKAKCKKAKLTKVKVGKVNLTGANLAGATITGAKFNGTNLSGVNLAGAKITNTTFTGVNVTNVDLSGAKLSGVRFVGVRSSGEGKASLAREAACGPPDRPPSDPYYLGYTCTGGGIVGTNGVFINTTFINSDIPGSMFDNASFVWTTVAGKTPESEFAATAVDRSTFRGSSGADMRFLYDPDRETRVNRAHRASAVGSFFDDSTDLTLIGIDASNSSFAGATGSWGAATTTGARGLHGTTAVTIVAEDPLPDGLTVAIVREDGYFKPGVNCDHLPCTYSTAAVGSPGKVVVGGTRPLQVRMNGWSCQSATPFSADNAVTWSTTCTVERIPAGGSTGGVQMAESTPETRTVTVNSVIAATHPPIPVALAWIGIETVNAAGAVLHATSCYAVTTCVKTVTKDSLVRITVNNASGVVVVKCGPTADLESPPPPNSFTYTCPAVAVNADLVATVYPSG